MARLRAMQRSPSAFSTRSCSRRSSASPLSAPAFRRARPPVCSARQSWEGRCSRWRLARSQIASASACHSSCRYWPMPSLRHSPLRRVAASQICLNHILAFRPFRDAGAPMITAFIAASTLAAAQPSRSILFVGNSFTFGAQSPVMTYRPRRVTDLNGDGMGGVPALFKRFAEQSGLNYNVSLETAAGQTLSWHLANKRTVIDRSWDAVVLQQYSTLNPDEPGDVADTIPATQGLTELLRQRNPHVDISLVATWTRPDLTYPSGKHWSGEPIQRMALDLRAADDRVRATVPSIARV